MVGAIQRIVRVTDSAVAGVYLSLFRERNAVLTFLFHSLFRNEREIELNHVDPLQRTTVQQFRTLIEYYLDHDYRFIGIDELLAGVDPGGRYAMLTFDDGYYNNTLALPVLEQYGVRALFFISTDHVLQNKCFWWDVLHRQRARQGVPRRQAYREAVAMKYLRTEDIERQLARAYGDAAFTPLGDVDRPFTPGELREFAAHPLVHLGNHTAGHAILTNYSPHEAREQIARGQEALKDMTGKTAAAIAYPNGRFNDEVVRACRDVGLRAGFTVRPQKCPIGLSDGADDWFRLGRFVPHAGAPTLVQCRTCRSDVTIYGAMRTCYLKLMRGVSA
jgi:peptidoglycan/xylan/chitin deacetylase (PgdA/CDA1 family)